VHARRTLHLHASPRPARRRKGDPLAHPDQAATLAVQRRADAVVGHFDLDRVTGMTHMHGHVRRERVLERVRETLLDDPVRGQADPFGDVGGRTFLDQLYLEPGRAHALDEFAEAVEARLGNHHRLVVSDDAEQAPQLVQRAAARFLDSPDRLTRALRIRVEDLAGGCRLHDHHAHVVRDDVVQLARDPRALLGRGPPDPLLAVVLARVHRVADRPADAEEHERCDQRPEVRVSRDQRGHSEEGEGCSGCPQRDLARAAGGDRDDSEDHRGRQRCDAVADQHRGGGCLEGKHLQRAPAAEEDRDRAEQADRHGQPGVPTVAQCLAERGRTDDQHDHQVVDPAGDAEQHGWDGTRGALRRKDDSRLAR
jgi:hypothetical protein